MLSPSAPLLEWTRSALQIRGQVVGRNMAALVLYLPSPNDSTSTRTPEWVREWIWDSAESKPRRPSSSLPRRGTYQITLSLSVWSVISWKTRSDVTDGAHGERAAEDEDMLGCRQTSSETGERAGTRGGAGRRFYFYFPAFSLQKIPWMQDKKTPEVKEFSICWITLMYILEPRSCQLSSDVSAAFFNNN